MALAQAQKRDQRGQASNRLQGREAQRSALICLWLGKAIDELVVADPLEPLQDEGRPSTIA
jgi:hypothetical protein